MQLNAGIWRECVEEASGLSEAWSALEAWPRRCARCAAAAARRGAAVVPRTVQAHGSAMRPTQFQHVEKAGFSKSRCSTAQGALPTGNAPRWRQRMPPELPLERVDSPTVSHSRGEARVASGTQPTDGLQSAPPAVAAAVCMAASGEVPPALPSLGLTGVPALRRLPDVP